jgi:hypothetical protein
MKRSFCSLVLFVVSILFASAFAYAQQSGGITGVITDASGAAIPNAQVKATNTGTSVVRTAQTNESGTYVLSPLPVGQYVIEASRTGFKRVSQPNVVIDINSALTLDLKLPVGNVDESITVTTAPPTIDTENSELGNYRVSEQIENLPIIVREVQTLIGQTPGVPYGTGAKVASDTDTVGGTYNASGSSRSASVTISDGTQLNSFQTTGYPAIDGIQRRADLPVPNIDVISSFKMVTSGASAEYLSPVAIIIATKSGTNALHGSAFFQYQSGGLSAHVWKIASPQSYVRKQYGGSAAGAIVKDKLFYSAGAEEFSYKMISNTNVRWPTAAEASGDLSELLGLATPQYIYDPSTQLPFGGSATPTDIIPKGRIDPIAAAILMFTPTAPAPPSGSALGTINAVSSKPEYDISQKYDGRIDWNLSPSNQVFFRTTIGHINQASVFKGTAPGTYGFEVKNYYTQVYTAGWTHVINSSSIFKFTFSHRNEPFKNTPTYGTITPPVAITGVTPPAPFGGLPAVTIGSSGTGVSNISDRDFLNFSEDHDYQYAPMYQKIFRNHTLSAGMFYLHGVKTEAFANAPWGQYTTTSKANTSQTSYASVLTSATGDSFADFLLGAPGGTTVTVGPGGGFLAKNTLSFWVQDDWKIAQNLTLNFGLRYDRLGYFYATDGRGSNSDFADGVIVIPDGTTNQIQPAFTPYASDFVTASTVHVGRSLTTPHNLSFSPRVGFAYRFLQNTVLRGGIGLYNNDFNYSAFSNQINNPPFTYQAKLSRSILIPLTSATTVNSTYNFENPSFNGNAAAALSAIQGFSGYQQNYPVQQAYEYNLTLERQLGVYSFSASYVGNLGRHIDRQILVNDCPPGPVTCTSATGTAGRKWTQFGTAFAENTGAGRSNYNALFVEAQRHLSKGIVLDANFALSKLLAYQYVASNPVVAPFWHYDYGLISQSPTKVFHFNYVYQLPFGHGKRFGDHWNSYVEYALGGWQLAGIGTWESGEPLTVNVGTGLGSPSPTGATGNRADQTCAVGGGPKQALLSSGSFWFNTACFARPAVTAGATSGGATATYNFGTAGFGSVIGPRWFSYDMNVQKPFRIKDRVTLKLRVDMLNILNHPIYANPDVTLSDSTFGQINSQYNTNYTPRAFQFSGRLEF